MMNNIQIIDDADNCTFSIFQATEDEFNTIFPNEGQDIEFSEDLLERLGPEWSRFIDSIWQRPIPKNKANGIHGTLFFQFKNKQKYFPKSKREKDWDPRYTNAAQRLMYGQQN